MITVGQLIEQLKDTPNETPVFIKGDQGWDFSQLERVDHGTYHQYAHGLIGDAESCSASDCNHADRAHPRCEFLAATSITVLWPDGVWCT